MRISYLTMALALASPTMLFAQSAAEITEQSAVEVAAVAAAPDVQISQSIERGDSSERGNWGDRDGGNVERSSAPQSRIESPEPAVAQSAPEVQIAGRGERGDRGERDFGGNRERGGVGGDWRGRGGNADNGSAPQQPQPDFRSQQPRFDPPVQPATPQFDRNRFGGRGNDGSTVNTSPPQAPQAQAQNDGGFRRDRGDRFGNHDGNREGGFDRRFGDRSGNGPQIDTRPQQRHEGQVFDQHRDQNRGQDHAQNHDGRFGQGGRPDVNRDHRGDHRNGVFTRGWQHDGDRFNNNRDGRFNGNRDGRFDRGHNGGSNHHFERHGGGWIDRGNRFGNDYGNNRNWNREWRGDRRYNWQGYRNLYRDNFRQPRYYNPYGYGYGYQRHGIGIYLNSLFFSSRYWINDPYEYRLPAAPYGYRWIRYYDDVLLVEQRSGYVVDVIYSFFW